MINIILKIRVIFKSLSTFFSIFFFILKDYFSSFLNISIPRYKIISPTNCQISNSFNSSLESSFVIVFQGPVFGDFTIDTIILYKKTYPNLNIIVSTWVGLNRDILCKLKSLDVIVLENQDVSHSYDNQNRMIASTFAGISHAIKVFPNSFLIKHRGDQRLTNLNWLRDIEDLLLSFPSSNSIGSKYRIGSLSCCSGKLRPYMIGDQFQFGYIDDMFDLWSAPIVESGLNQLFKYFKFNGYTKYGFGIKADNYIIGHYIMKNNLKLDFSLSDSNKFWASKGIVIDSGSVGFYWGRKEFNKKIESFYDCNPFNGSLSESCGVSTMSFSDWLHIYRTGSLSYDCLIPEYWDVSGLVNGLPVYKIISLGGLSK